MNDNLILWLWFRLAIKFGSSKCYDTYKAFGSVESIYNASQADYSKCSFLDNDDIASLCNKDTDAAQRAARLYSAQGIGVTPIDSDDYPKLLKEIENPPCVLFWYGNYEKAFSKPCITIVGTKDNTSYGETTSTYLSSTLAACGFTVGCGSARGIDTVVLNSAVHSDGSVIMVIPEGLIAAGFNTKFKYKELRYNGVVISEQIPEIKASKISYRERNRILSGIAYGTIVTQAPETSGALSTASYALDQGRDVFAVPATIDMLQSKGSNKLIRDGAIMVTEVEDVINYYLPKFKDVIVKQAHEEFAKRSPSLRRIAESDSIDFKKDVMTQLDEKEKQVYDLFSYNVLTVDYIIDEMMLPVHEVLSILSSLETKGAIVSCPGNGYKISVL